MLTDSAGSTRGGRKRAASARCRRPLQADAPVALTGQKTS